LVLKKHITENEEDKTYGLSSAENDSLFSKIAAKYDLLNHLLSLNIDKKWRRELVKCAEVHSNERILDICTGTGEVAIQFAMIDSIEGIFGVDLSEKMLDIAEEKIKKKGLGEKIKLVKGNAFELPFEDSSFDIVSVAFGLRNMGDYAKGISEMVRVLKDGGRLVMLEFSPPPESFFGKIYRFYLNTVIPIIGGMLSGLRDAYEYLSESVFNFPQPKEITELMEKKGLKNTYCKGLTGGVVHLYRGQKQISTQEQKEILIQAEKQTFSQNVTQGDLFIDL
jgi:demethylmenaquinone methyltransferase/2-methoxy-6-polyprenyl-1,4-benzoquinol methylase